MQTYLLMLRVLGVYSIGDGCQKGRREEMSAHYKKGPRGETIRVPDNLQEHIFQLEGKIENLTASGGDWLAKLEGRVGMLKKTMAAIGKRISTLEWIVLGKAANEDLKSVTIESSGDDK
jgi:hypothetical protein